MKKALILLLPLLLTGCPEDRQAALSECELRYSEGDYIKIRDNVNLCMEAKGYWFEGHYTDDTVKVPNNKCYTMDPNDPTHNPFSADPAYQVDDCYHRRSVLNPVIEWIKSI
jgi:hypothetical protein